MTNKRRDYTGEIILATMAVLSSVTGYGFLIIALVVSQ